MGDGQTTGLTATDTSTIQVRIKRLVGWKLKYLPEEFHEDILQDCMLSVLEGKDSDLQIKAACERSWYKYKKHYNPYGGQSIFGFNEAALNPGDPGHDPHAPKTGDRAWIEKAMSINQEGHMEAKEQINNIKKLPRREAYVLMANGMGFTHEEIGNQLGCSTKNINRLSLQAQDRLKKNDT